MEEEIGKNCAVCGSEMKMSDHNRYFCNKCYPDVYPEVKQSSEEYKTCEICLSVFDTKTCEKCKYRDE